MRLYTHEVEALDAAQRYLRIVVQHKPWARARKDRFDTVVAQCIYRQEVYRAGGHELDAREADSGTPALRATQHRE